MTKIAKKMGKVKKSAESSTIETPSCIPLPNISRFKNKQRRQEAYIQLKRDKKKVKKAEKKRKQEEAEALGKDAPEKQIPKTIENTRIPDETMVAADDEEVLLDESQDEMSSYFRRETEPKILITTSDRPRQKTNKFTKELKKVIPNSACYYRRGLALKKIIPQAVARDYTDLIVVHEDRGEPNGLVLVHLPNGPTAHFKLSSVKLSTEIRKCGSMSHHRPEIVMNNFNTRLGHQVARMFMSLFHHDPEFKGRRVATFHNQRDYIFFRQHRYEFKNAKRVGLQELGPRFTLKLRSLQKGTFDSKYGQYEWMHKRHEMETSRRKFFL